MSGVQILRFASKDEIEAVFDENHELWGRPLAPAQYRDYWFSLFRTPWSAENFRYMALSEGEDGPILSSLKLYRLAGRLFGRPVTVAGIGAVYTPRARRTFGSASLLVSEVLDYAQRKKSDLAILFSDIGLPFYERLGFTALPAFESSGPLGAGGGPSATPRGIPGVELGQLTLHDAGALAAFHAGATGAGTAAAASPLVIDRDARYWEFLLHRRFLFWELAPAGTGTPVSLAAWRGERILATGFAVATPEALRVQEAACLPGEEEALGAIVDRVLEEGRRAGAAAWHGRLPASLARIEPRLAGRREPASTAIPMVAPLGKTPDLAALAADPACELAALDHV